MFSIWRTTVGKKVLMAITGCILFAFVVVHMLGNLKAFQGPSHFNEYAEFLRTVGGPAVPPTLILWTVRAVLVLTASVHIFLGIQLWLRSRAARPTGYAVRRNLEAGASPAIMRWSGVLIAVFVVYHVLQFNYGLSGYSGHDPQNVYGNVITAFSLWTVTIPYIGLMALLGLHLYHGIWSMTQTLGINDPSRGDLLGALSGGAAVIVALGYILVPVSVILGILR